MYATKKRLFSDVVKGEASDLKMYRNENSLIKAPNPKKVVCTSNVRLAAKVVSNKNLTLPYCSTVKGRSVRASHLGKKGGSDSDLQKCRNKSLPPCITGSPLTG